MTNNLITVFTITFNCARYVSRCYKSLLNQNYNHWIWLIIDDGSTDDTEILINNLNDSRIQYYKIDSNVGRGKARNFGLSKIQSDWLAILDMDDLMLKSRLERFNLAINNGFSGLISSTLLVDNQLKINGIRKVIYHKYFDLFTHATLCINTNILKSIGYSESRFAEDQRVIFQVSLNCKLEHCDEPLYIYQEDASITIKGAYYSNWFAFINLLNIFYSSNIKRFPISRFFYVFKFGIYALVLFLLSLLPFANELYNFLIKSRIKDTYDNDSIKLELKIYEG